MQQVMYKKAYLLLGIQVSVTAILFMAWWFFSNLQAGASELLGGVACIGPNLYFIYKIFHGAKRAPQKIVTDFYLAEFVKLLGSVLLLIFFIKFAPVKMIPALTGYVGAYLGGVHLIFLL